MVLGNIRQKTCSICGARRDNKGKNKIQEVKTEDQVLRFNSFFNETKLREVKIKDIICRKHSKDLERKYKFVEEQEQLDFPEFDVSVSQHSNSGIDSDDTAYSKISTCSNDSDISNDFNNIGTSILVDIPLTYSSHSFCFICKTPSGNYIAEERYFKILFFFA
jgi:hypothetical protein